MDMVERLYVYGDKQLIGVITRETDGAYWFQYDEAWIESETAFALAVALPLRKEPFTTEETCNYFDQLLPEGGVEEAIRMKERLPSTFHFLKKFGADCAGGIRILAKKISETPEIIEPSTAKRKLKEIPVDKIYDALEDRELVATLVARENPGYLSIAGGQDKFVGVFANSRIYLVQDGRPTTHIFKAPIQQGDISDSVWNEHFCLTLAAEAGLNTVHSQVLRGRYPLLIVDRYDRQEYGGLTVRTHQQDAAQALGISRDHKYEAQNGPTFKEIYNLIKRTVRSADKINASKVIFDWLAFNLLIGNNDTHAKNISFCLENHEIVLSPFYDLLSTAVYPSLQDKFAFKIGGVDDFNKLNAACFDQFEQDLVVQSGTIREHFLRMIEILPGLSKKVQAQLKTQGGNVPVVKKIVNLIHQRCQKLKAKL